MEVVSKDWGNKSIIKPDPELFASEMRTKPERIELFECYVGLNEL